MGVEKPDIEIGSLESPAPEAVCSNVKSCAFLSVGSGSSQYFICYGLEIRLYTNIIAHLSEESGCQITDLIVSDGREASFSTDRVCSTEKETPQSHFDGNLSGVQPYLNARASWNAFLCKQNPCSLSGIAVSHVEDPLSKASSTDLLMSSEKFSIKSLTAIESLSLV